jgi:hypothetical protein
MRRMEAAGLRRRPEGSKQDVCDRKANPPWGRKKIRAIKRNKHFKQT